VCTLHLPLILDFWHSCNESSLIRTTKLYPLWPYIGHIWMVYTV